MTNIPKLFQDINGLWAPITCRSRILVYSNDRVDKNELDTYESLADEKWKNRILVRSSSNAYNQAHVASIVANNGVEAAEQWSTELLIILQETLKEMTEIKLKQSTLV